jgi:DNA-binding CsgD family transcriptional regulator
MAQWVGPDATDDLQLVRGVIEGLTAPSSGSAVVVGVDDGHLLDNLSIFVLHQIVARGAAKVVVTLRDGEPLPAGLREVWSAGEFERLDMQPLSQDECTEVVSTALGGPMDADTARRLWRFTRGNPLYLCSIVDQEVRHRRLTLQRGYWMWSGEPTVPPGLAEMIEDRIGALPPAVGDVVDTLAVGEPLGLASLTKITNAAAVEEAEVCGLIALDEVDGRTEARIGHPLYGEVRRRRVASTRLRRLRGLVATELAAGPDRDDMRIIVRRATLGLESDLRPDVDLLVRAAQGATWLADLPLADRLAAEAIRSGGGIDAYAVRAHVLGWLNRGQEAEAVLADCPTDGMSDADRARLAFLRAINMLWSLADPAGAKELIADAERAIGPEGRSCIDAFLTVYWATIARPAFALQHAKDLVLDRLPVVVCGETASGLVNALGATGRTDQAVSLAYEELHRLTRCFDAPYMRAIITEMLVAALLLSGRIREAVETGDQLRQQAVDLPGHAQSISAAVAGRAALGSGRLAAAVSLLEPVLHVFSASGNTSDIWYHCQPRLITALAMQGRFDEAVSALAELEIRPHPTRRFLDYEGALARAWVAAAQGTTSGAVATALSAAEAARENGQSAVEVLCLQTATQFGDGTSAARLRELEVVVQGPRVGLAARFAASLADGDAAGLESVSRDFEEMGDLVAAADAAAHAAATYRRADRRGTALTCVTRADELARRCGNAVTPALRKASEPVPFTDREREIVTLIGLGLSSRAIADRLTLSVRTVEGHIYRAMSKTGAADRDELARMVPRQPPGA